LTFNLDKIQKKAQQTEIDALKASVETLKANMETLEGENLSLKQKVCIKWNSLPMLLIEGENLYRFLVDRDQERNDRRHDEDAKACSINGGFKDTDVAG
jgi:hypothetical protein